MTVDELLAVTSDYTTTNVVDSETGEVLSFYDGRDSISKELGDRKVVKQYVQGNQLYIEIRN